MSSNGEQVSRAEEESDDEASPGNPPSESFYSLRLREWSRQIPVSRLSPDWEERILSLIPCRLKTRHPECLKRIQREVRDLYATEMVNCGTASIVGAAENYLQGSRFVSKIFDHRSEYRYSVPRERKLLSSKYFLSHDIMRLITETASAKLDRVAVDLGSIVRKNNHRDNLFELSALRDAMASDVARVAGIIKNEYYPEVVKIIVATVCDDVSSAASDNSDRRDRVASGTGMSNKLKLLSCATNLFAQRIVEMMIRTVDDVTESLTNYRQRCPRLKLRLIWKSDDSRLSIDPPISQIFSVWRSLVRSIEAIAEDLPSFEHRTMMAADDSCEEIRISLPDWYSIESHRRIDEALTVVTDPLRQYCTKMADEFELVTSFETRRRIEGSLSTLGEPDDTEIDFHSSVNVLNELNERASGIPESLDSFDLGKLDQSPARASLTGEIAGARKTLVNGMLHRHEEFNEKICQDFRDLRDKLVNVPNTARELFQLSELIAYSSITRVLEEFEERVAKSVEMLNSLLAVTSDMTERHTRLNGATINWLAEIKPIVVKSNTLCEAMKSELEDELQRRITRLNQDIEAAIPKFEILDFMDDATRVDDYEEHLNDLIGLLDELDRKIREINYEESLFKFPETSFSSVEEIREILVPVSTLNNLVKEWRRDHAVWMHGPFEYIDASQVREKTVHHYRENLEKLNSSIKAKIKNDMQQGGQSGGARRIKMYTGIVDDPDPMQQPAPLSLCSQVLEEVRRFEGHLELIDCVCNPSLRERHWREISLIYEQSRKLSVVSGDRSRSLSSSSALDAGKGPGSSGEPSISAPDAGTTLAKLIRLDLAKDMEKYRVISIGANKELALATRLHDMVARWETVDFRIADSVLEPSAKTFLHLDEIETLLEEHEVAISEMRVSYFVKPIASELAEFSESLSSVGSIVRTWLRLRSNWLNLELVFRGEVTDEELERVRDSFYSVKSQAVCTVEDFILSEPRFRAIADESSKLTEIMSQGEKTLETVRETVEHFVERIRRFFPRFYFISDREVIDIIFEPQYSKKMRLLVRKCFTDMRGVRCSFDKDNYHVQSIIDTSGTEFSLVCSNDESNTDSVECSPLVRSFLITEIAIKRTIKTEISQCFNSLPREKLGSEKREKDFVAALTDRPIELAGISGLWLYWTSEMERALDNSDLKSAMKILHVHELEQSNVIEILLAMLKGEKTSRTRRRMLVLFVILCYEQRDVTRLIMTRVEKDGSRLARQDFSWKSQIRYYSDKNEVKVSILDTDIFYGCEYSSCNQRDAFVRTPLTERCFHSLMEAHRNRLYGLAYGPGATGKTQTVRALAHILGVDLRVFDGAERHLDDCRFMENVFQGLTSRSSSSCPSCWLLFKNLDSISTRSLSIFAQRITFISSMENHCFVIGTISSHPINSRASYFFPDALKILFRPIAYAFPDRRRIVEVSLFAEGFSQSRVLAEKIRVFEKYSSQQGSNLRKFVGHFNDWDMRMTKSILKTVCSLKTRFPDDPEETLLVRALVDVHLPKLTNSSNLSEFQHLMDDLFPRVFLPPPNYENLSSSIRRALNNTLSDQKSRLALILKIIQLYESLLARQTVIVVGSVLSGKTMVIETLARSLMLSNDSPVVDVVRIHHESLTSEDLFGDYEDSGKLDWKDGVLTRILRSFIAGEKLNMDRKEHWHWLVLDGPLRAPSIEKLNSLIDENNRTLSLSSGERIRLADSTSVIFETSSTIQATPATISHCGVVYIEEFSTMDWRARIKRWIVERQRENRIVPRSNGSTEIDDTNDEYATFLTSLFNWSLGASLKFLRKNLPTRFNGLVINDNHRVLSVLRLFEIFLMHALDSGGYQQQRNKFSKESSALSSTDRRYHDEEEKIQNTITNLNDERAKLYTGNFYTWSQAAMLMSIVWGLSGSLNREDRIILDEFCKQMWRANPEFRYDVVSPPSEGLIQDNMYVFTVGKSGSGYWRHCSDLVKKETTTGDAIDQFWDSKANATSYVSTVDSVRYMSLFQIHVKYRAPFIISGETATGKSLYMRHLLKTKMNSNLYKSNFNSFSGDSRSCLKTSKTLQSVFLSRMKKLTKRAYGPGEDARLCVNFVDDMSIAATSKREVILRGIVRQYCENLEIHEKRHRGYLYDPESGAKISLDDVLFLGALDSRSDEATTGDWSESTRFFRHFNLYKIESSTNESIFRIYHSILLANLRTNMFGADVSNSVTNIVQASLEVYASIVQNLRPVPSKLQYRFNLRDMSRLIDGCSLIHKDSAETKVTLMRLWVHESIRTFADRITDRNDLDWFFTKMKESAASHFKDSWETVFDGLPKHSSEGVEQLTADSFRHLIFSNFMRLPDNPQGGETSRNSVEARINGAKYRYEEITCSRDAFKNRAIFFLERYNEHSKNKLDIIIFPQMLEHLVRICRILDTPGGSLLMLCLGGSSGRRSLTALAAYVESQRLEELSARVIETIMTPKSTEFAWREDLKRTCMNCIGENVGDDFTVSGANQRVSDSTFFISDREIVGSTHCPDVLEDICSLMKTGRITSPDFFTVDERDRIVERCRLLAQKGDRNREMPSHEIMDYFYDKCQEKLHFVLYFDRSVMSRREQLGRQVFIKILNQCTIDCYEDWPEEALSEIANKFVKDIDIDGQVRTGVITASKYFWKSMLISEASEDMVLNSPASEYRGLPVSAFIHMAKLYGLSINRRQNEIRVSREKYLNGLDKLKSAEEEVRNMRSTLTRLRPELELSARETAETMRKIERENVSVEQATIQVKREEEVANGIAEVAGILKEECEADLAVAIPILEDAIAALNTLKPADITLVKAMKNPPDTVKLVLAAVCVMLGVPPDRSTDPVTGKKSIDYWAPSKRILGDMNFLQNLKDYDKDNIPASVMSVVNKSYMNDESFMPHIVAKASSAAEGLCKWVRAMVSYDEVAKVVAPKKEKLAAAERECNASLRYLNEKRKSLAALNDKLAALNASLQATLAKKLQLENEVASCTEKLNRAEALIASLAGEKARWLEATETLARTCDNLAGDVLLSCGIVAILSSLSASQRHQRVVEWRGQLDDLGIPNSGESYEFLGSLRSSEIRRSPGTSDATYRCHRLSVNSPFNRANASILEHSLLWPLILDPQNQANMWIKQVESSNGLVVVKPTNPRWFAEIRGCMEKNVPVLLENLDRLEYLEKTPSILRYFGTSQAFPSSSFRFYMTSRIFFNEASSSRRLIEPHNMYKRFSVVNFTLANDDLEDRLLEIIVSRERPELRDTFDRLMLTSAANRRLLEQEEEKILQVLSGSKVNIIEDERAIETLDRWKNLSHEVKMREVETATATEREMNELRMTYRPLTHYCAALYDTLACLVDFNHMYRFSLDWFVRLYVRSIDTSLRSVLLDKRLSYLGSSFTLTLDASVRNALLDEHKLLYSLLLSIKILLDTKKMDRAELRALFLTKVMDCKCEDDYSLGSESVSLTSSFEIRDRKFLLAQQLGNALPNVFQDLSKSFQEDYANWESYWNGDRDESLPAPWMNKLTDFQRLILVNRLRPEKTLGEVLRLVQNTLGWNSITSSSSTRMRDNVIAHSYAESSCVVPLIFVLPSYLEPFGLIKKWAKTIGYSSKLLRFSIPPTSYSEYSEIEDKIETAGKHGGWILLENCHLASDEWLARLEEISESLGNNENTALSFRLWLTSYPSTKFPISILHDGTKVYCEQPTDQIKRSLLDFYATEPLDDPGFYNIRNGGNNARAFSKLVCALCFFHAVVTGRKRFYDRGWNATPYEFTDSDFKISVGCLRQIFQNLKSESATSNRKFEVSYEEACEENLLKILNYMVGECYYGGRILDIADRKCLRVILRDFCNRKLLRSTTNYLFDCGARFASEGQEYSVPNRTEYRDFIRHIKECLPDGDAPPGIFGLDDNAAILRDCENSDYFVHSLARSLSFIDSDISAHPDESNPPRLRDILEDVRMKLSLKDNEGRLDLAGVKNEYKECHEEPLNIVIIEQFKFYNELIGKIVSALVKVETRACELEYEYVNPLTRNKVPEDWMRLEELEITSSIDCSSLSRFIHSLSSRRIFLTSWAKFGHYEGSLWLGGIINCRRFLFAVCQTFSRKSKVPLDRFTLNYEVTKIKTDNTKPCNFTSAPTDFVNAIHIHGIYLTGARWDIERCTLSESQPKLYWNPMPMIRLQPSCIDTSEPENHRQTNIYFCPLNFSSHLNKKSYLRFIGSLSTAFISKIPLNSKDIAAEYWIKRRTVLFCNKEE